MLTIRMQRTGRKGHAMFRMVVQDARRTPTSGKVIALLGSYDPHAKQLSIDKTKADEFLKNGAHPSDRAARLLQNDGVKLPAWVKLRSQKQRAVRNPDKLRKNRPQEEAPAAEEQAAASSEPSSES